MWIEMCGTIKLDNVNTFAFAISPKLAILRGRPSSGQSEDADSDDFPGTQKDPKRSKEIHQKHIS